MDQMGHLLTTGLPRHIPGAVVQPVRHPLVRVASRGRLSAVRPAFFADRVINRMVLYPWRVARTVAGRYDVYHVVDHSYAQLALQLPGQATIVSCHDVDTFRSVMRPADEHRGPLFRAMTRRIAAGLRGARLIVCGSAAARDDLVRFALADPARLRVVPNGIDPALLSPASAAGAARAAALLGSRTGVRNLLHVGNDIPRKRVDRALEIVAALRARGHSVRLVRAGSPLRPATRARARELGVQEVVELPFIERHVLRAVYECSDVVLLPSDREGYGLPVVEAFAAGKPVIASDIPALRETGGALATLVPPDARADWVAAVEHVLRAGPDEAGAAARRAYAASRTWEHHLRGLVPVYAEILDSRGDAA